MVESSSGITECPHCHVKILPTADNCCPACRMDLASPEDVDSIYVSLTIHEDEPPPPYCCQCGLYTERTVSVEGEEESDLARVIRGLGSLLPHGDHRTDEDTANVFISMPQCERCSEIETLEPMRVDLDHQTMTFLVHRNFRDRVIQRREG